MLEGEVGVEVSKIEELLRNDRIEEIGIHWTGTGNRVL